MLKILLDTNVILDALASREPFNAGADAIFALAGKRRITAYVTASSVTDVYYVLRRKLSDETCRSALLHLFNLFSAISVTQNDCLSALNEPIEDFEDALMMVCARKMGVNYIITRDKTFLKTKGTISPPDFLGIHGNPL
jgi:predicted nucleic acid-binding protein